MTDRRRGPKSAPPIRTVTDAEVARHTPLVHFTLQRMMRRGQLRPEIDYDDHVAAGMWGVWEALRRWKPEKGTQATYLASYIWGYVMRQQKAHTKALGYDAATNTRRAEVVSYEETIGEDLAIRETLAAPDNVPEQAEHLARLADLEDRIARLPERHQVIARNIVDDHPRTHREIALELGLSVQRVSQLHRALAATLRLDGDALAATPDVETGVLLVDRQQHATERDAIREAARIHPGCQIIAIRRRKVRKGRVVAPQGRPAADGSLGRPVWAIELRRAA